MICQILVYLKLLSPTPPRFLKNAFFDANIVSFVKHSKGMTRVIVYNVILS